VAGRFDGEVGRQRGHTLLNDAFLAGRTFLDPLTVKAEIYALSVDG